MKKLHALILGATGATGKELVKLLLEDSNFSQVSVFVRRKIDVDHKKLTVHKIDFSRLNEYNSLIKGDILFSALGTTKNEAGGKKEQFLVDYTYQYEFAKMASDNGVNHFSLVSSIGADKNSFFAFARRDQFRCAPWVDVVTPATRSIGTNFHLWALPWLSQGD